MMQMPSSEKLKAKENIRRVAFISLAIGIAFTLSRCGGGTTSSPTQGALTGNWEILLTPHSVTAPDAFSGFLIQSGGKVSGSLILGGGCSGVGPVTGSFDGQNIALTINEFGQDLSLNGTAPSAGSLAGAFSTLAGGCVPTTSTGTWTAVQVKPISGQFSGTFSGQTNGAQTVSGTLQQGPNTGGSTASLSGSMTATSAAPCAYLNQATLNGVISGTAVSLNIFGSSGLLIGQISSTVAPATVTPDGKSISGGYYFSSLSSTCSGDLGTFQITFP